jgi:serine/threonine protein kinase
MSQADLATMAQHVESCESCCQILREIPDDALAARLRNASLQVEAAAEPDASAPAGQWTPPKELNEHPRYKIGRFLGAGGMGAVYQAEHRLMGRVVALKIIHGDLSKHDRIVERFRREVKAAARLSHPNIVTAYDAEQAGDVHFLVMEYVDGMSLGQIVSKKGPLEIPFACNFIRQAARGLQHAFDIGMVHRDIKPHNLMLTRKGQVKILDFGLARVASESRAELGLPIANKGPGLTRLGDIMGTPEYMSPEQIGDASSADIRSDIYSLGCTLYYLLTGKAPFAGDSSIAVLLAKRNGTYRPIAELRDDVPTGLVDVIESMLARSPAARYPTPEDVVRALGPFLKPGASPKPAPTATPATLDPHLFLAECPFCQTRLRVPEKGLGRSITCSQCRNSFTAVPIE